MMRQVRRWLPQRDIVVVADSSFAALNLLWAVSQMPRPVHIVTRLRLDAALYEPAAARQKGQMGQPRHKGKRLPTLSAILANPKTMWQQVRVEGWYGGIEREVELVSDTAVWYHTGLPAVPIRWLLVRDPQGKFESQAFSCCKFFGDAPMNYRRDIR